MREQLMSPRRSLMGSSLTFECLTAIGPWRVEDLDQRQRILFLLEPNLK
jgi:hypothetical protein